MYIRVTGFRAGFIIVTNATYSTYTYINDLLGRRTSKNGEQYGYNVRDELISADEVSYNYDDIGNRTVAEGKTYTANNLNQYTAIDDFAPQYDADGNQTLIKTETGIWSVLYNAENRPIRWQSGDTVITMAFDRMGRRVKMCTMRGGEETLQRFVYDNYLCVQQLRGAENTLFHSYMWDPTEPTATRPLIFQSQEQSFFYFHDGNKNVTELIGGDSGTLAVRYDYLPFGQMAESFYASDAFARLTDSRNPFLFSSEYYDSILALTYYNYRHYFMGYGRWIVRDPLLEKDTIEGGGAYRFLGNAAESAVDFLGLSDAKQLPPCPKDGRIRQTGEDSWEYRTGDQNTEEKPEGNGCGPEAWYSVFIPNHISLAWIGTADFTPCCNAHDVCYGTCGSRQVQCDQTFRVCLYEACKKAFPGPNLRPMGGCFIIANRYVSAVSSGGAKFHGEAQDTYCRWKPCCQQ